MAEFSIRAKLRSSQTVPDAVALEMLESIVTPGRHAVPERCYEAYTYTQHTSGETSNQVRALFYTLLKHRVTHDRAITDLLDDVDFAPAAKPATHPIHPESSGLHGAPEPHTLPTEHFSRSEAVAICNVLPRTVDELKALSPSVCRFQDEDLRLVLDDTILPALTRDPAAAAAAAEAAAAEAAENP